MSESTFSLIAEPSHQGKRVDAVLASEMEEQSRSGIQKLIEEGLVSINGKKAAKNDKLKSGDEVSVTVPPPKMLDVLPEDIHRIWCDTVAHRLLLASGERDARRIAQEVLDSIPAPKIR